MYNSCFFQFGKSLLLKARYSSVTVIAPARLHMGFIDLSGALGRHFGSIGVALEEIRTEISIAVAAPGQQAEQASQRALQCCRLLCRELGISQPLQLNVTAAIPEHVGLGSGTQLALAIGMGLNHLYGLGLSIREIAQLTERGKRSGIGIGVFELGGLVVDGGRGEHTITPPLIVHMEIPQDWHFILVFDQRGQGLHGDQEIRAFKRLPPFPQQEAARLCYLLMMRGLPALAEQEIEPFGEVITELQRSVGEHFAAAQGGVFASPEVGKVMHWLQQHGAVAIGQTSWGPTGFCAMAGIERVESLARQAREKFACFSTLSIVTASARNSGGEVIGHQ